MSGPHIDRIGRWSETKLEIVRDYAAAYTTILSKQKSIRRFVYIDAFAGAGKHISKQTGQFVLGSPANALNVRPPFDEFHFIDLDESRVSQLDDLSGGRRNVHVYHGDCNEVLLTKVFPRCLYEDFARGLCLLDPYKLVVDWKVLAAAGSMGTIEIFCNFMIMDANMNMLLKNPDKAKPAEIERMNAVWGDDSWRKAAYTKRKTLFGDEDEKATNERVAEALRKRLHEIGGFDYVPAPVPMKNSTGAVVYYLYFASPNKTGAKIVGQIFRKYRA
jgi:three-Cys-motif partner protein